MFWIFVSCLWSDQSEFMALFKIFNSWIGPGFILSLVPNFLFFNKHFPVTIFGLDLFSGAYLNNLLFLWCPVTKNNSI